MDSKLTHNEGRRMCAINRPSELFICGDAERRIRSKEFFRISRTFLWLRWSSLLVPITRKIDVTVCVPGARIAPMGHSCARAKPRLEPRGAHAPSTDVIMKGRVGRGHLSWLRRGDPMTCPARCREHHQALQMDHAKLITAPSPSPQAGTP